jgi:hypothetical protein
LGSPLEGEELRGLREALIEGGFANLKTLEFSVPEDCGECVSVSESLIEMGKLRGMSVIVRATAT